VNDFKNHQLPLARIKKIMKADEDVRMISAEAPVLFAKACEMFILELTLRSWIHTEENKRRTLQKNDIAAAITRTDIFDFLVDIVPRDELINKEDVGLQGMMQHRGTGIMMPVGGSPVSYEGVYYMPQQGPGLAQGGTMGAPIASVLPQQQQAMGSPSMMGSAMMVARPTMAMDPSLYQQQQQQQQQQSYIPQQQPMQQNLWHQQAHMANSQAGMPPNS
jgi:nuclear transcription factor Y gamma